MEDTSKESANVAAFKAQAVGQSVSTVALEWVEVPAVDVYEIEKHHKKHGWERVGWTSACRTTVQQLDDNFAYRFRIKALKLFPPDEDNDEASADVQREFRTVAQSEEVVGVTLSAPPSTMCLYRAIKKSQQYLIKRILKRRPSLIYYPARNGYLPLANAINVGELCIIDIILAAGASVHVGSPLSGRTPLHLAFFNGQLPVARILLNKKADINVKDNNGMTPSHCAVDANQYDMLRFALDNGADVEAVDVAGWTLILRAVRMQSDVAIVRLLHHHGSNLRAVDLNGLNCVELARLFRHDEALRYLESHQS